MDTPPENKKTKILIVLAASVATSLIFVVPWFSNHMRYEEYSKDEIISIKKSSELLKSVSGYTKSAAADGDGRAYIFMYEQEKEVRGKHEKIVEMSRCVNRYRNGNHPFALALTACKQELFYKESNKETPFYEKLQ